MPRPDPTQVKELAAGMRAMLELVRWTVASAGELARARRALYLEYVAAGFSEDQALDLCRDLLPR
jgi:hypothetical protein